MRRILIVLTAALFGLVVVIPSAQAVSAHFIRADVTSVTSNTLTVAFKEAGLGNSLDSVTITVTATAECINPGSKRRPPTRSPSPRRASSASATAKPPAS